ncbi:MAG: glycosyltransferase [bacterium]
MEKKITNITAIIPVHEYNETVENFLFESVKSLQNQKDDFDFNEIMIVAPDDILKKIKNVDSTITFVKNTKETTYQKQVMVGVNEVKTKYFTVIEFDDEVSSKYLANAISYISKYDNADIYMTTMVEVNSENKRIKDTNIQAWSRQLVGDNNEVGYINENLLMEYTDFKLSGAIIDKEKFIEIGGFKENIVFSFGFEFLLRAIKNNLKIFVIPKMLYKHLTDRKGSITKYFLDKFTNKEVKFWFDTAISESEYSNDREIDTETLKKDSDVKLTVKK